MLCPFHRVVLQSVWDLSPPVCHRHVEVPTEKSQHLWLTQTKPETGCVRIDCVLEVTNITDCHKKFPFSASTLVVWCQEGHPACKKFGVGLSVVMI